MSLLTALFRRKPTTVRRPRLAVEPMEDRLTPANLWVSTDAPRDLEVVREYSPAGTLLRSITVPPPAAGADSARDLAVGPDGQVHVFNGTFDPVMSTYAPATGTWSNRTFPGWSTANVGSYGGIVRVGTSVFVSDMLTYGEGDAPQGIVRFDLAGNAATRFAPEVDAVTLAAGPNGRVYALDGYGGVFVYSSDSLALLQSFKLPRTIGGKFQDFRGIAVNAAGDVFATDYLNNQVHRFNAAGVVQATLTVPLTVVNGLGDIDVAADGTVAVGSRFGVVTLTTESLAAPTYLAVGTDDTFVAFKAASPPPPSVSVNDVALFEGTAGTTAAAAFTVSLSAAAAQPVTVNYSTADGTAAAGIDYAARNGTLTFAPGETTKTVIVPVVPDDLVEADETFFLNLTTATGATLADGQGVATVLNDDVPLPVLTIADLRVTEGNSGSAVARVAVTLSAASATPVTVKYETAPGTATAGGDYAPTSGFLTFESGQTTAFVPVTIFGDARYELDETLTVNLTVSAGATIGDGLGVVTIANDDPVQKPTIAAGNATLTEGNAGVTTAAFPVTLSVPSPTVVRVSYRTLGGTAAQGSDFAPTLRTLVFEPGETAKVAAVDVSGDTQFEPNETFHIFLASPGLADAQASATIVNDDAAPTVSVGNAAVAEGNAGTRQLTFTVTLSQASSQPVRVPFATAAGTASAGADYLAASGTLAFAPGETSKTIVVDVLGDAEAEGNETVVLNLSGAVGATIGSGQAVGTILDDDGIPG